MEETIQIALSPDADATEPASPGVWRWSKPIDVATAHEFHARARELMKPGAKGPVILDLSESVEVDACGLQILVVLAVQALSVGRFFEIAGASRAIERDLQLAGVGYLLRQE